MVANRNYTSAQKSGSISVQTESGITKNVTVSQTGVASYCVCQNETFDVSDGQQVNVVFRGAGMSSMSGTGPLLSSGTAKVYYSTKEPTEGGFLDPDDSSWTECSRTGQTSWEIPENAFYVKIAFTAHEYMGAQQNMGVTISGGGSTLYTGTIEVNIQQTPTTFLFTANSVNVSVTSPFADAIFRFYLESDLVTIRLTGNIERINATAISYNSVSSPSAAGQWTDCRDDILGAGVTLNYRGLSRFNLKFSGYYNWTGSSVQLTVEATDVNSGAVKTVPITFTRIW